MGIWVGVFEEASGLVLVTSEKFLNLCAWRDEYINCNENKKYLPPRNELLAHFQARFQAAPK